LLTPPPAFSWRGEALTVSRPLAPRLSGIVRAQPFGFKNQEGNFLFYTFFSHNGREKHLSALVGHYINLPWLLSSPNPPPTGSMPLLQATTSHPSPQTPSRPPHFSPIEAILMSRIPPWAIWSCWSSRQLWRLSVLACRATLWRGKACSTQTNRSFWPI
jgi:hypothetical protein